MNTWLRFLAFVLYFFAFAALLGTVILAAAALRQPLLLIAVPVLAHGSYAIYRRSCRALAPQGGATRS